MPAGVLIHKCRLCGLKVETITPDAIAIVKAMLPDPYGWHNCGGGSIGVTDLIGAKALEPPERPAVAAQASLGEQAADAA